MNNNDLTFFTNEPERNLYDRFNKILKRDTEFFDVLVGYFRASGFYLLQDSLDNVSKIRILIGINTDKEIVEMYKESQLQIDGLSNNAYNTKKRYVEKLKKEFENSEDSEEVDTGVKKFISLLKNGKLEVRVYSKQPIHAKLYIMRNFEECADYGKVITGSSNFSANGLQNNLEFNVELKNAGDVKFASEKFEELWKDSIEVNQDCINTIEKDTWVKEDITPYEMYLKFLYEYFKEQINDDRNLTFNDGYVIEGFKPYQYQKDAVIQAKRILEQHNGVFISDVVGLGKTYMCSLLAVELDSWKLFLVPPVLIDYWKDVLTSFGVRGFTVMSTGAIKKISEEKLYKKYKYIFVDEAHKFRNERTETYAYLHEICAGKKVVLITATPQNNYVTDIASQMYLFESKTNSTIPGVKKLEQFFLSLRNDVKKYSNDKSSIEYLGAVEKASNAIRDKVLRQVMIRRTRTEIQNNYEKDMKKQGLVFPKVNDPIKETYEFDEKTEMIFESTIELIKQIKYARYTPLTYVNESVLTNEMNSLLTGQRNMTGFMKGILVMRLESSQYAFKMTLGRFISSLQSFIDMYCDGEVWISRKLNVDELLARDDIDTLLDAVDKGNAFHFKSEDFRESFIVDLKHDLDVLTTLQEMWDGIEKDNKLDYFIDRLKTDKRLSNKIIIFTGSTETGEYLTRNIEDKLGRNVIYFSGSMSDSIKNDIRNNFDPNMDSEVQEDNYDVLVTTDVLAEGMNLHRSNVVINYDLPWNPTRIMQRVGRINRVGTKFDELFIYNFFPTTNSNDITHQSENIISKIKMFHDLLGEDSKFLTDEENVSTHELFRQMTTIDDDGDTGLNSELKYLSFIRKVRDENPKLFTKIIELPKKIKIGRNGNDLELLTFFRKGYVKKFYISDEKDTRDISFDDAIQMIETDKNEESIEINNKYYRLLKMNKESFNIFEENDGQDEFSEQESRKGTNNARDISLIIKEVLKLSELTDEEEDKALRLIQLLDDGEIPLSYLKEAKKDSKLNIRSTVDLLPFYKRFVDSIPETYFDYEENVIRNADTPKEIVLSELFIK